LAYSIEGSDHIYTLPVRNNGNGQIEFTVPNNASFEILYIEDSLGNRYSLGGVKQVVNESGDGDNENPRTCPDGATDIACEVGVHVAGNVPISASRIAVSGNYAYVTTSENKFIMIQPS